MLYIIIVIIVLLELILLALYGGFWSWLNYNNDKEQCEPDVHDWNNPSVFQPKTTEQQWRTNETSHGYPFYWMMQYAPGFSDDHPEVCNHMNKHKSKFRNVIYLE